MVPTGNLVRYPLVPSERGKVLDWDLTDPKNLVDHCFVVDENEEEDSIDTRSRPIKRIARLHNTITNIHLEVQTTEPSFQCYTGDGIDVVADEGETRYGPRSGIAIEATRYVNAIHTTGRAGQVVLHKGETYGSRTVYSAW